MTYKPRTTTGWQWWTRHGNGEAAQAVWTATGDAWCLGGDSGNYSTEEMLAKGVFGEVIDPEREARLVEAVREHRRTNTEATHRAVGTALAAYDPPKRPRHVPDSDGYWSYQPPGADHWISVRIRCDGPDLCVPSGTHVAKCPGTFGRKLNPGPVETDEKERE